MVFNYFLRLFLFSAASLSYLTTWSQPLKTDEVPGFNVRHFTDENGLPQNSVKSIVRDRNGNIWMATERGLCRYDGVRFRIFDNFGSSFAAKNIHGFYWHPDNKTDDLLASTHDGKWIRISSGKAFIDRHLRNIPRMEMPDETSKPVSVTLESLPQLIETPITNVLDRMVVRYPSPGNAYFSYDGKFVEYYTNGKRRKRFALSGKSFFRFFRIGPDLYYLDESFNALCFRANGTNSRAEPIQAKVGMLPRGSSKRKPEFEIYWNNSSNQVFVSCEKTLYFLSVAKNGDLQMSAILKGIALQPGTIRSVFNDQQTGRIFLGSQLDGLYIVQKQSFRSTTSNLPADRNVYYGQALMQGNSIIAAPGTRFWKDRKTAEINSRRLNFMAKQLDWGRYSVLTDRKGRIWSKMGNEVFCFDSTGTQVVRRLTVQGDVTLLKQLGDDQIWIGTTTAGLFCLDLAKPDAQPVSFIGKQLPPISWVEHQDNEYLWIGSEQGLGLTVGWATVLEPTMPAPDQT